MRIYLQYTSSGLKVAKDFITGMLQTRIDHTAQSVRFTDSVHPNRPPTTDLECNIPATEAESKRRLWKISRPTRGQSRAMLEAMVSLNGTFCSCLRTTLSPTCHLRLTAHAGTFGCFTMALSVRSSLPPPSGARHPVELYDAKLFDTRSFRNLASTKAAPYGRRRQGSAQETLQNRALFLLPSRRSPARRAEVPRGTSAILGCRFWIDRIRIDPESTTLTSPMNSKIRASRADALRSKEFSLFFPS
ncbi:hypothetical protein B0H15DRAFT_831616 [Mycena belliarum]|uniref:Uncharacterized protein n=1 Tax=Mycena belliarum TaxID=1033014 RepID=A0AAD6UCT8_9AGAR|nr:hypothetical protein B0H15DRAFT_831616 [Mycena belliae]